MIKERIVIKNLIFGGIIGIANIIPGLSGGTMAVILQIYDELINAISDFKNNPIGSIRYLMPVGIGAVIAILLCSNGISYLLDAEYMIVNFFFIGIILGSIPMIYKRGTNRPIKFSSIGCCLITFSFMIFSVLFSDISETSSIINELTVSSFIKLFLASAVSAMCMIVPGISGSFVMLLLGVYTTIITAISDFNILLMLPIGLGVLFGLLGGAKLINIILSKYEQSTYFSILGFVIGSIFVLFNNIVIEGAFYTSKLVLSAIALIVGLVATLVFGNSKVDKAL